MNKILQLFEQSVDPVDIDASKPLNEQTESLPYNPEYELPRKTFVLTKKIREGQFGRVFKGELRLNADESAHLVAVKTPKGMI